MCHIVTHQTAQSTITDHIISSFSHIKNKTTRTNVLSLIQNDLYCVNTNSLTYDISPRNKRAQFLSPLPAPYFIRGLWCGLWCFCWQLGMWCAFWNYFLRLLIPVQLYYILYIFINHIGTVFRIWIWHPISNRTVDLFTCAHHLVDGIVIDSSWKWLHHRTLYDNSWGLAFSCYNLKFFIHNS